MLLLESVGFEWDNKMLVSSVNKIGTDLSFRNLGKSFINMRKSKAPKTEPWGTTCSVILNPYPANEENMVSF
jgi:hypothetical protein